MTYLSDLFKSDAERKVDALYGTPIADIPILMPDQIPTGDYTPAPISTVDSIREFFTPESYGESIVNQIYSDPASTLLPDPHYDPADVSSPNVFVKAKGAVREVAAAVSSFSSRALLIGVGVLLVTVAVYALVPALVKR